MATWNGFSTSVRPDTRWGDGNGDLDSIDIMAFKYTVPGSGTYTVDEVGIWCYCLTSNTHIKFQIYTDDAANGCPETAVANSETTYTLPSTVAMNISYCTYTTKPQVTGGSIYWLAIVQDLPHNYPSRYLSSGVGVVAVGSYDTWCLSTVWHTHTDSARDMSFYSVISGGSGTATIIPQAMSHYQVMKSN